MLVSISVNKLALHFNVVINTATIIGPLPSGDDILGNKYKCSYKITLIKLKLLWQVSNKM